MGLGSINTFKNKFTSVRPNRFKVLFPISGNSNFFKNTYIPTEQVPDIYIYCRSASLPSSKIDELNVAYLGRMYYDSGDRSFDPLVLRFYNSQDFAIRNFIEEWLSNINLNQEIYQISSSDYNIFMDNLQVVQLDRREYPIKIYSFYGVFPIDCAEIPLDYGDVNSIEEFEVTFRYQWWENVSIEKDSVVNAAPPSEIISPRTGLPAEGNYIRWSDPSHRNNQPLPYGISRS